MSKGVLIVIKSDQCKLCLELEREGFFNRLDSELDVQDVYTLPLKVIGPSGKAAIFDADPWFPNFKFMSYETFIKAQESGTNWKPLMPYIRMFNRKIDENSEVSIADRYLMPTFDNIQEFCNTAQISLGLTDDYYQSSHGSLALYED